MKMVVTSNKLVGEVLANPIYTERAMFMLKKMGVVTVYIEDENDELCLQDVLPTKIKFYIIKLLKDIYEAKVNEIISNIITNINLSENASMICNLVQNDKIAKLAIHSLDVTILCIRVGITKKYDEKKLLRLGTAALLHNIGRLFCEDEQDVKKSYAILKRNTWVMSTTFMAVYYMYEREDGSGLFGATGDKTHEFAKILGICNEYIDCITGEDAVLPHIAIEKIAAQAVEKFDKDIYRDFSNSVYCYPNGLQVALNNGQNATVVMQNIGASTRPILAVKNNEGYKFCDLTKTENLTLFIEQVLV